MNSAIVSRFIITANLLKKLSHPPQERSQNILASKIYLKIISENLKFKKQNKFVGDMEFQERVVKERMVQKKLEGFLWIGMYIYRNMTDRVVCMI